jgi:hypothetical protein
VSANNGIFRVDPGRAPVRVDSPERFLMVDRIALDRRGHLWAVGTAGLHRYDGRTWSGQ